MRPAITLVHRRRNSGSGGLSSPTSSSTSPTPIANSSVIAVKRPHPYRWNSLKRTSSPPVDSSHQYREERACARRKHRTSHAASPKRLSPSCSVSVSPSPAFSGSSSAASVDLRSESHKYSRPTPASLKATRLTYISFHPCHPTYDTLLRSVDGTLVPFMTSIKTPVGHCHIHVYPKLFPSFTPCGYVRAACECGIVGVNLWCAPF